MEKERTANIGLVLWRGNILAHTRHRNQAFYRYVPLIDTTPSAVMIWIFDVVAVFVFQFKRVGSFPTKVFEISNLNKRQLKSE